ncbi:hypothetical protein [Amphibacillus marinus]|nr:hypothetical protein [Amphibacillus marinus]
MKKVLWVSGIVVGSSVVTYLTLNKQQRNTMTNWVTTAKKKMKLKHRQGFPIEQAGDPIGDHLENANMVSEGSQYGVNYYNEIKQ